jgi:Fur family transcriptional regulator, ferric uptake regulator
VVRPDRCAGAALDWIEMATVETPPTWYEHASRALARAGYRRGAARDRVLALLDAQQCARTAVEIEDELRQRGPRSRPVSRASIYRILDELASLGLVTRIETGSGHAHYEAARGRSGHHHHLVCDHCGALTPFTDSQLERTIHQLAKRVPLDVSDHEIILHGACSNCAH